MAGQFRHEALAKAHDLAIGFALGVEIGSALSAAHGKGGQAVLEDLLEAEKLQDAQIDARVETQATLVGSDGGVELHPVAPVDLDVPVVIGPRHAELDDALRLNHSLEQRMALISGIGFNKGNDGLGDLFNRLDELGLVGIPALGLGHERLDAGVLHDDGDVSIDVRCECSVAGCQVDTSQHECLWTFDLFKNGVAARHQRLRVRPPSTGRLMPLM